MPPDQKKQELKEINNLHDQLNNKLKEEYKNEAEITKSARKKLKIYNQIVEAGKEAVKDGKINAAQLKGDVNLMTKLMAKDGDINKLRKQRNKYSEFAQHALDRELPKTAQAMKGRAQAVDLSMRELKTRKLSGDAMAGLDQLTGGLAGKGAGITKSIGKWGAGVGLVAAGIAAAVMILISFSAKLDAIGQKFGAIGLQNSEIKTDLLAAEQEAARLGKGMAEVITATTALTDQFGIGFEEARKTSLQVLDLGMAIGVSDEEAAKLIGNFKILVGLSTEQSIALAKNVTLLANANDVAPQAVLRDLANSSEQIALFTKEAGENIARGAIQARKFGIEFSSIADTAKGLVNYQDTLNNALEASILLGEDINPMRMMELSLAGDTAGLMIEQRKILKDINFLELDNFIMKEAAAKAVGLTAVEASKLVSEQEKAVTLAGQLAGQPGFDELIGTEGISTLTQMNNAFKSMGALLTNSLGPALNAVLKIINLAFGLLETTLEFFGINTLLRAIGGQGFTYDPGKSIDRLTTGIGLHEGGVVPAQPGGMLTNIGEGGEAEAVMPLSTLGNMGDNSDVVSAIDILKKEMRSMNDALKSLKLTTRITNKELNIVLSPQIG